MEKMVPKILDIAGKRFGRLVAVEFVELSGSNRLWKCVCDCGKDHIVAATYLNRGLTKSCGCLRIDAAINTIKTHKTTHGMTGTKTYYVWKAIQQRCNNSKRDSYSRYGGRGIKVCERWSESFENFLEDMGICPSGMSIEREDFDGNYEPSNCRWATSKEQANNRSTNRNITHDGRTQTMAQWAEEIGISSGAIYLRLKRGLLIGEVLKEVRVTA